MSDTEINFTAQPAFVGGLRLAPTRVAYPGRGPRRDFSALRRWAVLGYGVVSYLIFFVTFLYAIGFMGGFVVPTTLSMTEPGSLSAIAIDVLLLAVFAVQHSVMARPAFKRAWTRVIPKAAERSTYVLFSSLALILLFAAWQPIGEVVWSFETPMAKTLSYIGFAFGWVLVFASTCLINHFDLFGLRQVWLEFNNKPYTELEFVTPWPYRVVRHPLYLGWLFAMWCTPFMTASHFLFAALSTAYIFVGIALEERDLKVAHPKYADYAKQVPMIFPRFAKKSG